METLFLASIGKALGPVNGMSNSAAPCLYSQLVKHMDPNRAYSDF